MANTRNQQGFSVIEIVLVVLVVGLIGAVGWLVYDRQSGSSQDSSANESTVEQQENDQQEEAPRELSRGDFGDEGEFGVFEAEGYATIVERDEAFCDENCEEYEYVFFNITDAENPNILNYLENSSGNDAIESEAIGMGCLENGEINYHNSSDENGSRDYSINSEDTTEIMDATEEDPIALEIEKLEYTSGRDAPTCYSLFTHFEVLSN